MLKFKDLDELQSKLREWLLYNFKDTTTECQFMGVVEEIGELAHAELKHKQGIRGWEDIEKTTSAIKDAVGDITIFLINYCNTKNINFSECLCTAIEEISKRDWVKNPETGV